MGGKNLLRVVIDTNVLMSGLAFKARRAKRRSRGEAERRRGVSAARKIIDLMLRGRGIIPVVSKNVLEEYADVAARDVFRDDVEPEFTNVVLPWLRRNAVVARRRGVSFRWIPDEDDAPILHAAFVGKAVAIATRDKSGFPERVVEVSGVARRYVDFGRDPSPAIELLDPADLLRMLRTLRLI